jgi:phenylpropionate dioxygenase-like ring-hydroxylating dioxygenase large terminal subunit
LRSCLGFGMRRFAKRFAGESSPQSLYRGWHMSCSIGNMFPLEEPLPPASAARAESARSLPRGCTFTPGDWAVLATFWHPVARTSEVADSPVAVRLLDQDIVLYRTNDGITAAADLCAHRGAPLSMGRLKNDRIACAYHGYCYDSLGACVDIPAHPDGPIPAKLKLRVFPSTERYGLVWVLLDPSSTEEIPSFPEATAEGFQVINIPPLSWDASAGRQIESFCDVAHFAFVHESTFAVASPVVPRYLVEPTSYGLHADFTSNVGNVTEAKAAEQVWRRIYDIHLPFVARLVIHFPGKGQMVILNAASPRSARQTQVMAVPSSSDRIRRTCLSTCRRKCTCARI